MIKSEQASLSIKKIAMITVLLILIFGVGVMATNIQLNNVKIILSNNYEMNVITTKTKVKDVLQERHIVILPDENVVPNLESEISNNSTIAITKSSNEDTSAIKLAEENSEVSIEQLLSNYTPITEKIITEQVEIPYETIVEDTKEVVEDSVINTVITEGKNGLKETIYKVRYRNDVEIERNVISEAVIKEPVNKVVQVGKNSTTRASTSRKTEKQETKVTNPLAKKVIGKTPTIKKFNTSAYCSCSKCCGKKSETTSSGVKASSWYTLAAGSGYPIGTIIYIPYFKDKPNEGWFIVQDRGGKVSNSKLDVYMATHSQAIQFGRKTLECHVYM